MKKKIVLSLLVVVLVLAGLSGGVYASNIHKANVGDKLVGLGSSGTFEIPSVLKEWSNSVFFFTNPDCINSIDITKISVIRGDGTVIYEGPFIWVLLDGTRVVVTEPMQPHQVRAISLASYMYKGTGEITDPNSWLDIITAITQPSQSYTVEVSWKSTAKKASVCPLMGYWTTRIYILRSRNWYAHW